MSTMCTAGVVSLINEVDSSEHQTIENDVILMKQVLAPYFENTKYLKKAKAEKNGEPARGGVVSAQCDLVLPDSCYIRDTGHFNSVEFNICYNQIMYYLIAISVKHNLLEAFKDWTLETYFKKQLRDIYIVNFSSKFKEAISERHLLAEIDFIKTKSTKSKQSLIYLKTLCRFYGKTQGYCEGCVDIAIVDK